MWQGEANGDPDEELEEGEVSDEDEETRKERLKPPPVCRFYNKGACTWGASCRFIHPGVMDTGRYSMFAQPRPILPGAGDAMADAEMMAAAAEQSADVSSLGISRNYGIIFKTLFFFSFLINLRVW